jgi:hypothetical protein
MLGVVIPLLPAALLRAELVECTYIGPDGGTWNLAASWSCGVVPSNGGGHAYAVTIDGNAGADTAVLLDLSAVIDWLVIDAGDALGMNDGRALWVLAGPVTNNGLVSLNSIGGFTHLGVGTAGVTFTGTGAVALGSDWHNRVVGVGYGARLTNGAEHTFSGGGSFGIDMIVLTNHGLIDANLPGGTMTMDLNAGAANQNDGTIRASAGGALVIVGTQLDNTGGVIEALDDSTIDLRNAAWIIGGELHSSNGGLIRAAEATATLQSLTNAASLSLLDNSALVLQDAIINDGVIALQSAGSYTQLFAGSSDCTLNGTGAVTMGNPLRDRIVGTAYGNRLINGPDHTISGAGALGIDMIHLTNHGLIDASRSGEAITIDLNAAGTNFNDGTLQASAGGTVAILGTTVDNAGGSIQALAASFVDLLNNSWIVGGHLDTGGDGQVRTASGIATLQDLTNLGDLVMLDNTALVLRGTIVNEGTIEIQSTGSYTQLFVGPEGCTLSGTGTLRLQDDTHNRIVGVQYGDRLTNGPGHTIRGAGQVGVDYCNLTNQGTILADRPAPMIIDVNSDLTNEGVIHVSAAGGLTVSPGTFSSSGTVEIGPGSTLTRQGNITVTGGEMRVHGTLHLVSGSLTIEGGALVGDGVVQGGVANQAGTVDPGPAEAVLTIAGSYAQAPGGTLRIRIAGDAPGAEHDVLAVSGAAGLDGILEIVLAEPFIPYVGQEFTILTCGARGGEFHVVNSAGFCAGYTPTGVFVTYQPGCPADLDCDGETSVTDFLALLEAWGPCAGCPADLDDDGTVNVVDFLYLLQHWGACP